MKQLAVDTSCLIAIINAEPEGVGFASQLNFVSERYVSAATLHEAYCVAIRSRMTDGTERLSAIVNVLKLIIIPFDVEQLECSRLAYLTYGRGTGHRADLNMGDCFSYALAKTRNLPLLFKGDDFIHTDIEPALKPA